MAVTAACRFGDVMRCTRFNRRISADGGAGRVREAQRSGGSLSDSRQGRAAAGDAGFDGGPTDGLQGRP
ncbi:MULTISPECIES: hypothetical protein [unclassified Rhodanobacter]|uniref:hypothetical protein n=1 Tax=unclassified Rhodanobacter TaxID=2621553 RepID=UPI001617477B|nr:MULTISPECIES: hypothetical protein [unclassified Rhodanobacter]MBB6241097.1 hypothetical protein [Rhodanobacter sp. MP1X3]MBB6248775.1 hypothetical protein [Rhodanobacter sp. A1T4]